MKTLQELCRELWEKARISQKKIASDLGISDSTFKGYVYKGLKPKDPKLLEKIRRYLRRAIKREALLEEVSQPGIAKSLKGIAYEIGGGDVKLGIKTIKREMKIPNSTFNNWYYKNKVPKKETLESLASYFTKKLGRKITEEFLLGEKVEEKLEPKVEETKKEGPKKVKKVEKVKKEEPKEPLIETAEMLTLMIKDYVKGKKLALSSEEMDFLNRFRALSDDAKRGLLLFLDNVSRQDKKGS